MGHISGRDASARLLAGVGPDKALGPCPPELPTERPHGFAWPDPPSPARPGHRVGTGGTRLSGGEETAERALEVGERYFAGQSPAAIAEALAVDEKTVIRDLIRIGMRARPGIAGPAKVRGTRTTPTEPLVLPRHQPPPTRQETAVSTVDLPPTQTPALSMRPAIRDLLDAGKASTKASTRALAVRCADGLNRLRELLDAEAVSAEAEAAIRELEAQLAEARAKLHPAGTRGKTRVARENAHGSDKELRAWAAQNGVACNPVGRVSKSVRQAWAEATTPQPTGAPA
jgi:hypothetical protein